MSIHPWYDGWLERKDKYARTSEPFLSADRFSSIAVGIGLPNIVQKSTFSFRNVKDGAERFLGESKSGEKPFARIYTRLGNPTTEYLEKVLFRLDCQHLIDAALAADERKPTIASLVCASGMAAIACTTFALVKTGSEIISGSVYGCTDSFFRSLEKFGINTRFVDTSDIAQVEAALAQCPNAAMVYLETPDNPTLHVSDISAISKLAEARRIPLVVDNTFATPYLQQPFRLGADIVIQSLTKYVNGHSTSIAGVVIGPWNFMGEYLFPVYKDHGPTPSPFDSWLNAQGLQTMPVRMEQICDSAQELARRLEAHPRVARVWYPGLDSHPHHALAKRQMRKFGGMISFELEKGFEPAQKLMNYFADYTTPMELAVSLGSAISYIQHPASMTHSGIPEADRLARGITQGLVRWSVGLEGVETLWAAMEDGLKLAYS
ncbi:MAG TPA: aminotransferase class I/II-fold pyridoxal phosphate-dependent enzyme [Candidatus Ozemobacteraceae bacterium]|nr:aminotransferase class I/II-fold pyridoxal phosphate-dependent enzyme [Candidatus Ozemobacteraceae bacterium]